MNAFVEYLNSTNNASGNSTGSLAESQVKSIYFDKVKVDRKLGRFIADTVKKHNYHAFILTGHAGDGKTSVLVQVLKELQLLNNGESLEQLKDYQEFFYVKDMSEIAEEQQVAILERALSAPAQSKSSLLISNTGPLINSFMKLAARNRKQEGLLFENEERINLQSKLLTQLDLNADGEISVEGYNFYLVNIARVDNVVFSAEIYKKIISIDLWENCSQCSCVDHCPIHNNIVLANAQKERISRFIESYYRYLYENDKRMTIRQMVGQISYGITGNLTCDYVANHFLKEPFFNYNFANLFFGYIGLNEGRYSSQIKGISQLKLLGLDHIALDIDYRLFVNNDYSAHFTNEVATIMYELKKKHRKHYQVSDEESAISASEREIEAKLRRAVRRFYLVYSSDLNEESVLNQIYGTNYTLYEKLVTSKQPKSVLRKIQTLVFRALYMKNTGFLPGNTSDLPLTLRRENGVFQNVMLVLGNTSKSELNIIQKPVSSLFEDTETKQELYLVVKGKQFLLTLPMLTYFDDLVKGSISSNNNPALTHGIAKLDTLLLEVFGDERPESEDDCELTLLINTTDGQDIRHFAFDGSKLSIV